MPVVSTSNDVDYFIRIRVRVLQGSDRYGALMTVLISVNASLTRMTPLGLHALDISSTSDLSFQTCLVDPAGEESLLSCGNERYNRNPHIHCCSKQLPEVWSSVTFQRDG